MTKLPEIYSPSEKLQVAKGIYRTSIDGLLYMDQSIFKDERGFFAEVVRLPEVESVIGKQFNAKQINYARSEQNVVRGIHAEGWNKCTFVTQGKAFCVLADLRPQSETFCSKEYIIMGEGEGALQGVLFITSGIGNSMCVLEGPVDYIYIVDRLYKDRDPGGDQAVSLFDPDLSINWPIPREKMIISKRDESSVSIREKYPESFKK